MRALLTAAIALTVLTGFMGTATADLTYVVEGHQEVAPPDPDRPVPADSWQRHYLAEQKWRRDVFFADPAAGGDPVMSVIRLDEEKATLLLDWQNKKATRITDESLQKMMEIAGQLEELLKQMPEGMELPGGMQMPPFIKEFLEAGKPAITVTVEGPLGEETVCGLSCEKWKLTTVVQDAGDGEYWGHTVETTEVWVTDELEAPEYDCNPWRWDPSSRGALYRQAYEEAIEGLEMPEGLPAKSHSVVQDLRENTTTTSDWVMTSHDEGAIAETVFEASADFTVEDAEVPNPEGDE